MRDAGSIPRSTRSPEEGMATHSSVLAWRIPWTEEPGGLQSIALHRVGHNCSDLAHAHSFPGSHRETTADPGEVAYLTDSSIKTVSNGYSICWPSWPVSLGDRERQVLPTLRIQPNAVKLPDTQRGSGRHNCGPREPTSLQRTCVYSWIPAGEDHGPLTCQAVACYVSKHNILWPCFPGQEPAAVPTLHQDFGPEIYASSCSIP